MSDLSLFKSRRRICDAVLVLAFLALLGFNMAHHAMWRDEMQPWLFARNSSSIPQLLNNMRYETHTRLWYLILFCIARFTANPIAMQAANWLIIGSAIALLVWFCPLPFYQRALGIFGYFFVWEWGTLSRNYALGVLFCFAFCALYPKRNKGWLPLAAVLFLATQSNQYAALIAAALAGLLILEAWIEPDAGIYVRTHRLEVTLSLLLVLGGVVLAIWIGIPQPDATQWNFNFNLGSGIKLVDAFEAVWDGFYPLSLAWCINWVLKIPGLYPGIGVVVCAATILFFWRWRLIFWTYLAGGGLLWLLAYVKTQSDARHAGHFFLWFLICLWLAHRNLNEEHPPGAAASRLSLSQSALFISFLLVSLAGSIYVSVKGYYTPFSCSREVADYLVEHHLDGLPIVAYPDYSAMPVAGYLGKPIYYLDTRRLGTFIIENNKRDLDWNAFQIWEAIKEYEAEGHGDFLVLLDRPMTFPMKGHVYQVTQFEQMMELTSFESSIAGEDYWLYHYDATIAPALKLKDYP